MSCLTCAGASKRIERWTALPGRGRSPHEDQSTRLHLGERLPRTGTPEGGRASSLSRCQHQHRHRCTHGRATQNQAEPHPSHVLPPPGLSSIVAVAAAAVAVAVRPRSPRLSPDPFPSPEVVKTDGLLVTAAAIVFVGLGSLEEEELPFEGTPPLPVIGAEARTLGGLRGR